MKMKRIILLVFLFVLGTTCECISQADSVDYELEYGFQLGTIGREYLSIDSISYPGEFVDGQEAILFESSYDHLPFEEYRIIISRETSGVKYKPGWHPKLWVSVYTAKQGKEYPGIDPYQLSDRYCLNGCDEKGHASDGLDYWSESVVIADRDHDSTLEVYVAYRITDASGSSWRLALRNHGITTEIVTESPEVFTMLSEPECDFAKRVATFLKHRRNRWYYMQRR